MTDHHPDVVFNHMVYGLLGSKTNDGMEASLRESGNVTVFDIAVLSDEEIEEMVYHPDPTTSSSIPQPQHLKKHHQSLLRHFGDFIHHLQYKKMMDLKDSVVLAVTKKEFDYFRIGNWRNAFANISARSNMPQLLMAATSGGSGNPFEQTSLAQNPSSLQAFQLLNFVKGIKRDKLQYPDLKDEMYVSGSSSIASY
jgi:hypothetical protein